jgi:hypothetical protein
VPKAMDVLFDEMRKRAHMPGLFRDTGMLLEAWCASCASSGTVDADLVGEYIAGTARGLGFTVDCAYDQDAQVVRRVIGLSLRPSAADGPHSEVASEAPLVPGQQATALPATASLGAMD